jgi:hypothetical protein
LKKIVATTTRPESEKLSVIRRPTKKRRVAQIEDTSTSAIFGLPVETLIEIVSWLDKQSLGRTEQTCRSVKSILRDPILWGKFPVRIQSQERHHQKATQFLVSHPFMSHFDLSCNSTFSQEELIPILRNSGKYVKRLDLFSCSQFDDGILLTLAKYCPNIETVKVSGSGFTDEGVVALVQQCPRLKDLSLWQPSITDRSLHVIVEYNDTLDTLSLQYANSISDNGVLLLGKSKFSLSQLEIGMCDAITKEPINALITRHTGLTEIDLSGNCHINDASIELLVAYSPQLIRLNISYCMGLGEGTMFALSQLSQLNALYLDRMGEFDQPLAYTDEGLRAIFRSNPKLIYLDVLGCNFDRDLIEHLRDQEGIEIMG